ncbi:MAG TPA: MBL fold metallo-hydrolase [Terrimicrobium sp.]
MKRFTGNLGDWIGATAVKRSLVRATSLLLASIFCWLAPAAHGGLDRYQDLVVADGDLRSAPPKRGLRVTYLGTNAYLLESRSATLLVDPYFSRMSLLRVALNLRALPKRELIERYLPVRQIDAVIVTHGHIDHLLDAAEVMTLTGARLIASPTSVRMVESLGKNPSRCIPVVGGETVRLRGATVRPLAVQHDRLFGRVPFDGPPRRLPPRSVSDWVCGEPLAFLIEMGGRRLYIESGGRPNGSVAEKIGPVDLAILGVALPDARKRFPLTLQHLRPRYVLPSHQDDFFRPLSRGFVFGAGSDFPSVLRAFRAAPKSSSMILLDYFQPWTLP